MPFPKVFVNEFEEKLTAHHNKAMDDEAGFERASKASEKAAQRNAQKTNAGKIRYLYFALNKLFPKSQFFTCYHKIQNSEVI